MGDFDNPFHEPMETKVYIGDQEIGTISDIEPKAFPDITFEVDKENSTVKSSFGTEISFHMRLIYLPGHNSRSRMKNRAKRLMRGYHADKC